MAYGPLYKTSPFRWTQQRSKAALLVAADELPDEEIAKEVGVSRQALAAWKTHPDFAAMVGDHVGQFQAGMLRLHIAKKRERVKVLDEMHTKLLTVVEERAADYAAQAISGDVPAGGGTGLILRQIKQIGSGHDAQIVEEFGVDTGLIREVRALHEQAAKELGQWTERSQVETFTTVVEIVGVEAEAI